MYTMSERKKQIVTAAIQVFLRYGVKRTGMNDIAVEAGISRQTLYNAFSNKDAVLKAAIRHYWDQSIADISDALPETGDLGEKLDLIFQHVAIIPFEALQISPNAEDIVEGFNSAGKQEIDAGNARYRELIETVLKPYQSTVAELGLTLLALSEFVQKSAVAAKNDARQTSHLLELLTTLKILTVTTIDGGKVK